MKKEVPMTRSDDTPPGHAWQERRSWLMHREAVRMLQADPSLAERALATLARWDAQTSNCTTPLRERWVRIIAERDWAAALDTSDVGHQLRQASPLPCLLPDDVRMSILAQVRQEKAFEAEMREWDSMTPVGRELGSPDWERLMELDHLAFVATVSLEAARAWLDTPHPALDGLTPEEGARMPQVAERVRALLAVNQASSGADRAQTKVCRVIATWDNEASVWVASSDDVAGLATEAPTLDALEAKLAHLVPELLELNGQVQPGTEARIVVTNGNIDGANRDSGYLDPPARWAAPVQERSK